MSDIHCLGGYAHAKLKLFGDRFVRDDPSSLMRNHTARVLWDVATWHPEIAIPLEPVLRRLDGPSTSDRSKTALVIEAPSGSPAAARCIAR